MPSCLEDLVIEIGSNQVDSKKMSVVLNVHSLHLPPIIPAIA